MQSPEDLLLIISHVGHPLEHYMKDFLGFSHLLEWARWLTFPTDGQGRNIVHLSSIHWLCAVTKWLTLNQWVNAIQSQPSQSTPVLLLPLYVIPGPPSQKSSQPCHHSSRHPQTVDLLRTSTVTIIDSLVPLSFESPISLLVPPNLKSQLLPLVLPSLKSASSPLVPLNLKSPSSTLVYTCTRPCFVY